MRNNFKNLFSRIKEINYKETLKALSPYIVAIITGVISYYLYAYLDRDIITVQSVSVRPKDIILTLDRPFANRVAKLMNGNSPDRFLDGEQDLTAINKEYLVGAIKSLRKRSEDLSDQIEELNKKRNQLTEIKTDTLSKDDYNKIMNTDIDDEEDYSTVSEYGTTFRKIQIQRIKEDINTRSINLKKIKGEIDAVLKIIAQRTKKALDDNSDKFQVEIIAFNEGNKQTVIRNKGTLYLGQTLINLTTATTLQIEDYYSKLSKAVSGNYQQSSTNSNYIIIEPKKFIVMNLEVDNFNNKNRDIKLINREYLSGQSTVELTLYNIKNAPVKPYKFLLQNDIEINPNNELIKSISPFLNEELAER